MSCRSDQLGQVISCVLENDSTESISNFAESVSNFNESTSNFIELSIIFYLMIFINT